MLRASRVSNKSEAPKGPSIEAVQAELKVTQTSQDELKDRVAELEAAHRELAELVRAEVHRIDFRMAEIKLGADAAMEEALAASAAVNVRQELVTLRQASETGLKAALAAVENLSKEVVGFRAEGAVIASEAVKREKVLQQELLVAMNELEKRSTEVALRAAADAEDRCLGAITTRAATDDASFHATSVRLNMQHEVLTGAIDAVAKDLKVVQAGATAAQQEHADAFSERLVALREELQAELHRSITTVEDAMTKQFADVESRGKAQLEVVRDTLRISENTYSRAIVWQARSFKHRLSSLIHEEDQLIRSPTFSLCCLPDMRLEVQMACRDDGKEAASTAGPALPLPGSCSIGLWAPPGLRVVFKLSMGDGAAAVSRRYEHTFQPSERVDDASRVIFVVQNFCRLNQVWVRDTDTVKVSLEMLEFQCPPISPLPALATPQDISGDDVLDTLHFTRSALAQELVHERVSYELSAIKNRSVRRVEWRLDGCARLLECRVGEAIDSPIFSAAGLERIQFHFYPRDMTATGSAAQPCGFFVSGPTRTTLKGMLWVGAASRSLEHRFQKRGDTAGRSRFCALEGQVDCNDTVLLAIDIIEVETDLPDQASASLCLRDARIPGSGQSPPASAVGPGSPLNGTKGSLRMKREDPSKTEEFVKCVSLPTLNARQLKMPLATRGRPGT